MGHGGKNFLGGGGPAGGDDPVGVMALCWGVTLEWGWVGNYDCITNKVQHTWQYLYQLGYG